MKRIAIIALALGLSGCNLTEKPPLGTDAVWSDPGAKISLAAPVGLNLARIEEILNKEVPQHLHQVDQTVGNCITSMHVPTFDHFKVRWEHKCTFHASVHISGPVLRNGPIKVSGKGDTVTVHFPVKTAIQLRAPQKALRHIGRETIEGAITVIASAKVGMRPDWTPDIALTGGFNWDKPAQFEVLGQTITFRSQVEDKLRGEIQKQLASVATRIPPNLIKEQVEKHWKTAHAPVKLHAKPEVWANAEPSAIKFSGIDIQNNVLRAAFGVEGSVKVVAGAQPQAPAAKALPALVVGPVNPEMRMRVPVFIEYAALREELIDELRGLSIEINENLLEGKLKGSVLKIKDIDAFPSGDRLAIEVKLVVDVPGQFFDVKGSLYALVKPKIDHAKRIVDLSDLQLTAVTNSRFVDGVTVLALKSGLVEGFKSKLVYQYGKEYDEAVDAVTKAMNQKLRDDVVIVSTIKKAEVEGGVITKQGLVITADVTLQSELKVGF